MNGGAPVKKIVTALMLFCCGTSSSLQAATIAGNCNPVAVTTCGLPFPSDLFMDQQTQRLSFDDAILDRTIDGPIRQSNPLRSQMDPSFSPAQVFNGSNGFSAAGPIMFELPSAPAGKLPKDGGDIAQVFDLDTGSRIDMVVEMSMAARLPLDPTKASSVVTLWPRSRLEFGHRYVAVLTTALQAKAATGSTAYSRSAGMEMALGLAVPQTVVDEQLVDAYGESLDVLQMNGVTADQVLAATFFTVRSESEVTGPLMQMADYIQAQPLKVSALKPGKPLGTSAYGLGTLYGRIDLVNFRDANGGVNAPYDPVPSATQDNVQVLMTIPRVDANTVMPVALWAHGVGNQKEVTRTGFDRNDAAGIVSVSIDHPNHGSRYNNRVPNQEAFTRIAGNPKQVIATLGAYIQASLDQVAVMTAVKNNINTALDEARPLMPGLAPADPQRLVYHSLSFGSMVGVAAVAVSDDSLGAFFLSGCGGLMRIFATSLFWDGNKAVFPIDASGAEVVFQIAMMQHYVDIADGLNFAHYYRNPPAGKTPKKVVMQYAIDDGNVVNDISEAQAIVMDLPLMRNVYRATPWLRAGETGIEGTEDGYGIYQLPYLITDAEAKLAEAAVVQQQLTELAQQSGSEFNFSVVDFVSSLIYNSYLRFKVHLTTGIPESMLKNRAWNCEILQMSPELCVRGIETQVGI